MKALATISAIGLIVVTTTQAHALSCTPTGFDLEKSFKANQTAGHNVVYVLGKFSGKQNKPAKKVRKPIAGSSLSILQSPKATVSNLVFTGKIMTKNGVKPFKQKIKATASCAASWCGNIPKSGQKTIAAFTKTNTGYTLNAGPCAPNTFSNQINKDWKKLKRLVR